MKVELTIMEINQTQKLVKRPEEKKVLGVKYIFRTKWHANGSINSTKSDLLKGYTQIFYIDFHDTFFHVARLEITLLLLDIAA